LNQESISLDGFVAGPNQQYLNAGLLDEQSRPSCSQRRLAYSRGFGGICKLPRRKPAADPRAIAAFDHAGTRLDDLDSVVLHVVIRLKIPANLDAPGAST